MGPRGCQRAARARAGREVNEVALKQRADVEKLNGELQAQLSKNLEFIEVNPELFRRKLQGSDFYAEWKGRFGPEAWALLESFSGKLA